MNKLPALFTFGYEGLTIEAFIERLHDAQVKLIVDVRDLPLSRKKGFSKNSFRDRLAAVGIAYYHQPALGCPKPVRNRYKVDGDWTAYTQGFLAHLAPRANMTCCTYPREFSEQRGRYDSQPSTQGIDARRQEHDRSGRIARSP